MTRLTGSEVWDCDGLPLTPAMRLEALAALAEMYRTWAAGGVSYEWVPADEEDDEDDEEGGWGSSDGDDGRLEAVEQRPVDTVDEFLSEYTGDEEDIGGWTCVDFRDYEDEFHDWLTGHLRSAWGDAVEEVEGGEAHLDPLDVGWQLIDRWVRPMAVQSLLDWQATVPEPDWRRDGF